MAGKVLRLLLPVSVAVLIAVQWRDMMRYLRIKQMSFGDGHPEVVPVEGDHRYRGPGSGVADGTAEFDSASRGGPDLIPEPRPRPPAHA
jgi:hypothetical protein